MHRIDEFSWARIRRFAAAVGIGLVVAGCGRGHARLRQEAVAIPGDAVSASCGMRIAGSPGPRGEVFVEGRKQPLIFGSTRDLLGYVLQPENQARLEGMYVQDSARVDWHDPSDAADTFIPARKAYYVAWQTLPGSMGPTLATFADMDRAMAFRLRHGGQVLRFAQITPELISLLRDRCPQAGSPAASLARQCLRAVTASGENPVPGADGMMRMSPDGSRSAD
jgi:copper chaperone NosL